MPTHVCEAKIISAMINAWQVACDQSRADVAAQWSAIRYLVGRPLSLDPEVAALAQPNQRIAPLGPNAV